MITLVLGGARSGKSAVAERLATELAGEDPVTYLATATPVDDDMAARIAAHRARRPARWRTVETGPCLVDALQTCPGTALVDALGPWVASLPGMTADGAGLCQALTTRPGDTVVVSEEVGLGVHPSSEAGRRFRDQLGALNQAVAAVADRVLLVVAGRVLSVDDAQTTPAAVPALHMVSDASAAASADGHSGGAATRAPSSRARPGGLRAAGRRGLASALAFLTPLGRAVPPVPSAVNWFPVVGAGLGAALGAAWWLAAEAWPVVVAAAVVVAADLALTGMLHLDGLVDSADGLLPPLEPRRRLEAMADPHVGAFGVGVASAVLLLRWASLATLRPSLLLLSGLWCASRSTMAVVTRAVPYARPGGLADGFRGSGRAPAWVAGTGLGLAAVMGSLAAGLSGALAVAAVGLVGMAVVVLAWRRIGGFTGDVLGAAGMVGETAGLLVAAARW